MNELQVGIEFTLAVFPQPSIFLQPGKAALDDLAFRYDCKSVWFAALGNLYLYMRAQNFSHVFGKWFSDIAAIAQQTLDFPQARPAVLSGLQRTFAISHTSAVVTAMACGRPWVSTAIGD
ncbi:hypothetical protein SAMN05216317_11413 [Nitrosomonas eutropha]|uniref:Uncharacterized protein n=1 Tax=Nitrosomonas eutropha TaxID=916 RepID=A0ABX5M4A9_9PROT|nr:hypothetical protein C8R14_13215 [Nitrosomonas eutropha]SDW81985.1 hypothetical protein SAMN05216317_11413 [Nitrosomonas eutropha]SEI98814.1 hypothetical protein SAMN05216318_11914 [Nitrosomonas eutropha]